VPGTDSGTDTQACARATENRLRYNAANATNERKNVNFSADELFNLPEAGQVVRVSIRLVTAAALGGLLGIERESVGKAAGLRTHMLVALGAALFVVGPAAAGLGEGDLGRIIQGIAAGIGFIGAGTILKLANREEIQGLTTAASVWLTAAIGVAAAVGPLWVPVACAVSAWVILSVFGQLTTRINRPRRKS
jgi:putative Mg2+ transporter-C (MgtC) family protein